MKKYFVCTLLAAGVLLAAQAQANSTDAQEWSDAPNTGFKLSYDQPHDQDKHHYNPVFNYLSEVTVPSQRNGNDIFPLFGLFTNWDNDYQFSTDKMALKTEFLRMAFYEFLLVDFMDFLKDYDFEDKFGDKHCWPENPPLEAPVPAAAWLFGSALLSMVGVKRLKNRK